MEELERIVSSRLFSRSDRLCRFLRFAVDTALRGEADRVKEYVVGSEVFGRGSSFDPRVDPVVRVEARRLRSRLKDWYQGEGGRSRVIIELPTGSYSAVFHEREKAAAPPATAERTIAILPFVNVNGDPEGDYLSDGMTEELIHALTRLSGLRVMSWNSASHFKGREQQDLAGVRERLRVDTVLRGSVRRGPCQLRVTAQLIETATGFFLWSEAWDRSATDLFAIEEEIAQAIANALRLRLGTGSVSRLAPQAASLECYNLYLKGRFHWNTRTREGFDIGIRCFLEATEIDPHWPLAWCGLADAYALRADYGFTTPAESMPASREAAEKALRLDPTLGEAWNSLAFVRSMYEWEWEDAERMYRRAIELNPGYAVAHLWYAADFLPALGRLDEALHEIEIARALDPLSPYPPQCLAFIHMFAGRYEEANAVYEEIARLYPLSWRSCGSQGRLYSMMGEYAKAIELFEQAHAMVGAEPSLLGAMGQTYALAGRADKARHLLRVLEDLAEHRFVPATSIALIHTGLGDNDRALDWLEKGADRHDLPITLVGTHPAYASLHGEQRFEMLLSRIGLRK